MGNGNCCKVTNQNDKEFDVEKICTGKREIHNNNNLKTFREKTQTPKEIKLNVIYCKSISSNDFNLEFNKNNRVISNQKQKQRR